MKFVAFSDAHLNTWGRHNKNNYRVKAQMEVIEKLFALARTHQVPLLFGGDLFHTPDGLSNSLISLFQPWFTHLFNEYNPVEVYAISGNHDMEETNSFLRRSPSYINTLARTIKNFHCIDFESVEFRDFAIHGIPYITYNEGFMSRVNDIQLSPGKKNVLLLHTDFKGQKDTNGIVIGKGENIQEEGLDRFDFVLSGHIHKPEKLRKNIYSIGAPFQIRASDMGGDFGYWTMSDSFSLKFRPITSTPQFRFYTDPSEVDDFHIWIKKPMETEELAKGGITLDLSNKVKLLKDYLDWDGNKSKLKKKFLLDLLNELEDE